MGIINTPKRYELTLSKPACKNVFPLDGSCSGKDIEWVQLIVLSDSIDTLKSAFNYLNNKIGVGSGGIVIYDMEEKRNVETLQHCCLQAEDIQKGIEAGQFKLMDVSDWEPNDVE